MTKTTKALISVIFVPAAVAALIGVLGSTPPVEHPGGQKVADMSGFIIFFVAFAGMLAAPWWPIPGLRERSRFEKLVFVSEKLSARMVCVHGRVCSFAVRQAAAKRSVRKYSQTK